MSPSPPLSRVRAELAGERTFDKAFRIGRTDECEVCIKNEHVSRKHVEVVIENGFWLVRDLQSANGIFVNGERVQSVPVFTALKVRLGIYGPFVDFEVVPQTQPKSQGTQTIERTATHYFGNPDDPSIGEHTRMIRRAFAEVQTKQKRKYGGIIAGLVLCAVAVGGYAFYLHQRDAEERGRSLSRCFIR